MSLISATSRTEPDCLESRDVASESSHASSVPRSPALVLLESEFERLYGIVHRYLLHRLFDPELADELTARTFYRAAASVRRFHGDAAAMKHWLLRIATNITNTHYRRQRLRQAFFGRLLQRRSPQTEPEPAPDSKAGQRRARIRGALLALRPKYQTVVVLRFYAQMSFADIADVVGCREDAVRARLSRALKELRDRLGVSNTSDSHPSQTDTR